MTQNENFERYILSVLVHDVPAILARIVGLFSGRGYNIDSLTVGHATTSENVTAGDYTYSRMTIVTSGNAMPIEHIVEQIRKLIDVVEVRNLSKEETCVEADVTLVKVYVSDPREQADVLTVAIMSFHATSIIIRDTYLILRFPGGENASRVFVSAMEWFGKVDSVYSGTIALA